LWNKRGVGITFCNGRKQYEMKRPFSSSAPFFPFSSFFFFFFSNRAVSIYNLRHQFVFVVVVCFFGVVLLAKIFGLAKCRDFQLLGKL